MKMPGSNINWLPPQSRAECLVVLSYLKMKYRSHIAKSSILDSKLQRVFHEKNHSYSPVINFRFGLYRFAERWAADHVSHRAATCGYFNSLCERHTNPHSKPLCDLHQHPSYIHTHSHGLRRGTVHTHQHRNTFSN